MECPSDVTAGAFASFKGRVSFKAVEENVRRLAGIIASAALAVALVPCIASASPPVAGTASFDLPAQVMMRIFGESSDGSASLAAAYGDRISESPLRDLALGTAPALRPATFERRPGSSPTFASSRTARFVASDGAAFDLAQSVGAPLLHANLRFAVTPQSDDDASARDDAARVSSTTFTAGQYQPVAPVTLVSPQSGAFSLGALVHGTAPTVAASSALAFGESGTIAGSAGSVQAIPSSVRLGPLKFTTRLESASMAAPSVGLNDNGAAAGANLDVRAERARLRSGCRAITSD